MWLGAAALALGGACACDPSKPETLQARECSLCAAVAQAPGAGFVVFLKDANPAKPNRWLALPRAHTAGMERLGDLTPVQRTELWTAAIARARAMWGEQWAVALNGEEVRTQCHLHIHVGKLLDGVEWGDFVVVASPAEIPLPGANGLWIHQAGDKLHVHTGEQITETVLLR